MCATGLGEVLETLYGRFSPRTGPGPRSELPETDARLQQPARGDAWGLPGPWRGVPGADEPGPSTTGSRWAAATTKRQRPCAATRGPADGCVPLPSIAPRFAGATVLASRNCADLCASTGGLLCRNCGGRGLVVEMFSFFGDEETCPACRGAGRVF